MPTASIPSARTKRARTSKASSPPLRERSWLVRSGWLPALAIFAITCLAYYPVIHYPFVGYDDPDYVSDNHSVQQGLTSATFLWSLTSTAASNWHPLTWISHALDCELFALDAGWHHVSSVVLHAANGILVFLLLWRATKFKWRSFLVAAVFAVHPLNVESVAWIAERKTVLSMFFFLLAVAAYGWYARKPYSTRYAVVSVFTVFALASKPMVVTLPFVLLLLDFWPLRRVENGSKQNEFSVEAPQRPIWELIREKLPLLALSAGSCAVTLWAQKHALKAMIAIPLGARIKNAIVSYVLYLGKAIWPLHLGVFYAHHGSRLSLWQTGLALLLLVGTTALVWKAHPRKYLLIGWLWYLGTLVPMIGLVQVGEQGMADRYTYLPMLGIFVAFVWLASDVADRLGVTFAYRTGAAVILLSAMLLRAHRQVTTWESTFAMWTQSLSVSSENYVAEDFVGATILEDDFQKTGQSCADEALIHFQNAVRINPEDALGHLNVGFCRQAHEDLKGAVEEYRLALRFAPNRYLKARADLNLGAVSQQVGQYQEARTYFIDGLKLYPLDQELQSALGQLDAAELAQSARTRSKSP